MATKKAKPKETTLPVPEGIEALQHMATFRILNELETARKVAPAVFEMTGGEDKVQEIKGSLPAGVEPISQADAEKAVATWIDVNCPEAIGALFDENGIRFLLDSDSDGGPFRSAMSEVELLTGDVQVVDDAARAALGGWYGHLVRNCLGFTQIRVLFPAGATWERGSGIRWNTLKRRRGGGGGKRFNSYAIIETGTSVAQGDEPDGILETIPGGGARTYCRDNGIPVGDNESAPRALHRHLRKHGRRLIALTEAGKVADLY